MKKLPRLLLPAALCLATFPLAPAALAGPGAWEAAASMGEARGSHTATLLSDGTVLVAAGYGAAYLASAKVYTPGGAGTWADAGALITARYFHTATALADGSVLVAGGFNGGVALKSAQIYVPATKQWSDAGSLSQGRYLHTATRLADGTVLVVGGYGAGEFLSSVELYTPGANGQAGTWTTTSTPLATARYLHTATALGDGTVLVAGGFGVNGALVSAELYARDAATNQFQWTTVGAMSNPRQRHTATLLADGKVLVVGGTGALTSAEIYDPATKQWSPAAPMSQGRYNHTATLLADGKVLVAGGYGPVNGGNQPLASAELYDPVGNTWSEATALSQARYDHTATLLKTGQVLVAGGRDVNDQSFSSAEIYTPENPAVTPTPPTPGGSVGRPVVAITGKKITTMKASVKVKGTATGEVTAVLVKAGKKSVKAKGTTSWSAKVKVKPGVNRLIAVATGPGGTSAPAKMKILRR